MTRSLTARHPRLARALATTFVALAALLVAVWVAPRASGAAATWIRTPSVRLHTLTPPGDGRLAVAGPTGRGAGAPLTLDAGMRFSMAGVTCDASAAGSVAIRLRTSLDGAAWGPWLAAPLEVVGENGTRPRLHRPRLDRRRPLRAGRAVRSAATRTRRPHRRASRRHRPHRRRQRRRARHRRRPALRGHGGRRRAHGHRLRGGHHPGHRHPCGVGRRRVPALRRTLLRTGQDRVRAPHGERQRLLAGGRARDSARHLRLPHEDAALERHRLQLPRRPLRHHLRRTLRRRRARRHRRAGGRLQHRQHRHLRPRHVHRRGSAGQRRSPPSSDCWPGSSASTASTRRGRPRSPAA